MILKVVCVLALWAGLAFSPSIQNTFYSILPNAYAAARDCGEKIPSIKFYQDISLYSLVIGFSLFFGGVLTDKKKLKFALLSLTVPAFVVWGYVNYLVDYAQIQKNLFVYKVQAESALANIAEGQERYKSEHGAYLDDLNKLYSHLAGAHGVDPCVRILELHATNDNWTAVAKHVSSPEKVYWDGKTGSALKKG
jgi:hypothetical protein